MILGYIGAGALLAGLVLGGFSALLSFWAGRRESPVLIQVGRRAFYAATAMTLIAGVVLETALLTRDFSLAYVAAHTDTATPVALAAAAFYGGQEGSLLYWTLILGLLGSAALVTSAPLGARVSAYATGVLAAIVAFFLFVLAVVASPFEVLPVTPPDGLGLNPILRDGGMLIHPPVVLAGFAAFAIPFAFASASLLAGRSDAAWIRHTRRFALVAWGLQSAGLLLGMWWAYHVLGWGGYWGWDPVENVALMPWLATTAYLHSSQVQERRGRLRVWNLGLVMLAFLLVVFGTFIVRSGIVPSVHTFAISAIGPWFLCFLGVCLVVSGVLLAVGARVKDAPRMRPADPISREGAFVLQNVLLVGVIAVVFWGTVLPLVSGMFGVVRVVGAPYYEHAAGPLLAALLALLAVGPPLPWRRAGLPALRALRWPASTGAVAMAALVASGVRSVPALVAVTLAAAAAATVFTEYARALKRDPASMIVRRRRYGAYLAHFGLVLVVVGIAASQFGRQEKDATLAPGGQVTVAGYTLTFTGLEQREAGDHTELVAAMRFGDRTLEPSRAVYAGLGGQALTHVAITTTPVADVYVVLAGVDGDRASFRVFVNPLVTWIWAGGAVLILGVVLGNAGAMSTELARRRVPITLPV